MATKTEPIRPPPRPGIFSVPGRALRIARKPTPHKTRQKQEAKPGSAEKTVRDIRRATRRRHSSEEKIRIVLEGLRGEDSIAELCRREGLNQNVYYRWSKEFLEAGKKRLAGDTARDATSDEVKDIRAELRQLKEALAETLLENRLLKKSVIADGGDDA
jgi:transposase